MSISSINVGTHGGFYVKNRASRNQTATASSNTGNVINLKITDEETGSKALASVGFPDGRSVSVFKTEDSSENNPQYMLKSWERNGNELEYTVNPLQVNPEHANYYDMLAYSAYLDVSGQSKNAFGDFLSASRGVNGDITYDAESSFAKKNFKSMINDFMQAQYNNGNYAGYLSVKKLHDLCNIVK